MEISLYDTSCDLLLRMFWNSPLSTESAVSGSSTEKAQPVIALMTWLHKGELCCKGTADIHGTAAYSRCQRCLSRAWMTWQCVPERMLGELESNRRVVKGSWSSHPLFGCPYGFKVMLFTSCHQMRIALWGGLVCYAQLCQPVVLAAASPGSRSRVWCNSSNEFKRQSASGGPSL